MTDLIELRGLRVLAYCGVLPEEHERRQPFALDLDIATDLSVAGDSDDLSDTVNYAAVMDAIDRIVREQRFELMERFAHVIANAVLNHDSVEWVEVAIAKLRPPVTQDVASTGVRIRRSRSTE